MKNKKAILIFIIGVVLTLISIPYMFINLLMFTWSTTQQWLSWVLFATVMICYVWVWRNIIHFIHFQKLLVWKKQLIYIVCILLCGGTVVSFQLYHAWEHRFETISTEVDLEEYKPFASDRIAKLDEASSLQIKAPLPVLDGATALYPIYSAFAQAIYPQDTYSPYDSKVICATTPYAYENLLNKTSDIIFVGGPSEKQKKMFSDAGEELVYTPIGKEGFVFFVNKDNPVTSLTSQQIKDIYSGKITNWKEVGGKDSEIRAFQRPEGSGSQSAMLRFMGNTPLKEPITEDVPEGMGGIISQTADYQNRENAIGYSFRFYASEMASNDKIRLLEIDGVAPTKENIQNGTYPSSSFYAITLKSNTNEKVKQILEWIVSNQGQELVEKTGYVSESFSNK